MLKERVTEGTFRLKADIAEFKQEAARHAVGFLKSGMIVGLGHGSTAVFALRYISQLLKDGRLKNILGIPCSYQVEREAQHLGIPLTTLEEHPVIEVTIDGADEVDPNLNVIKGAGGALLREKIVAQASLREIIVVDESKLSPALGTQRPVPLEVAPFGWETQVSYLESIGGSALLRQGDDGTSFKTDQGNLILDCTFGPIDRPAQLAANLSERAGIIEHGLFLGLVRDVIVGGRGGIRHLKRGERNDPD